MFKPYVVKTSIRICFTLLITVMLLGNIQATCDSTLFHKGNAAFSQKNYPKAIEHYQQILKTNCTSSDLYYNLGNTYFEQNQLGYAVLYYEKGLHIDPNHPQIQYNLRITNNTLKDDIVQIPNFFLIEWWNGLRDIASSGTWSLFAIICLWAAIGGISLWLLGQKRENKKIGFSIGLSLLLLSILLFILATDKAAIEKDNGYAVILSKEIALKNGMDEASSTVVNLHEGTKVRLMEQIGDWYKIQLANGEKGWLPYKVIGKI